MAVLLVLAGCASTPPAPVEDRSTGGRRHAQDSTRLSEVRLPSGSYRVQRGDTLYSIAFRNGLDYRELAQTNRIGPPYTIDRIGDFSGGQFVDQAVDRGTAIRLFMREETGARVARKIAVEVRSCGIRQLSPRDQKREGFPAGDGVVAIKQLGIEQIQCDGRVDDS